MPSSQEIKKHCLDCKFRHAHKGHCQHLLAQPEKIPCKLKVIGEAILDTRTNSDWLGYDQRPENDSPNCYNR